MFTIEVREGIDNPAVMEDTCQQGHSGKKEVMSVQFIGRDDMKAKSFGNDTCGVCVDVYCEKCEDNYFLVGTISIQG